MIKYSVYKTNGDSLESIREEEREQELWVFITVSQKNILPDILQKKKKKKKKKLLLCYPVEVLPPS